MDASPSNSVNIRAFKMSLHSEQSKTDYPSHFYGMQQKCDQLSLTEVLIQRTTSTDVFMMHENLGETMKDLQSTTKLMPRQRLCSNVISPDFSIKEGRKRSASSMSVKSSSMSVQSLDSISFDCFTACLSTPGQNVAGFVDTMTMAGLTLHSSLASRPNVTSTASSLSLTPRRQKRISSLSAYTPSPARFSHSQSSQFASSPCEPSSQASPQCSSLSPVKIPRRPRKSNTRIVADGEKYATHPSPFMTPGKVRESPISEERPTTFFSDEDLSNDDEMVCLSKSPGMARFLDRANGIHSKYSSPSPSSMVTGRGSGLPPRTPVPTMRLTTRKTPQMPPTAPSVGNFTDGDLFESSPMCLLSPPRTKRSPLPNLSLEKAFPLSSDSKVPSVGNSPSIGLVAKILFDGLARDPGNGTDSIVATSNSSSLPADRLSAAGLQECPPSPHAMHSAGFPPVDIVICSAYESSVGSLHSYPDDDIDDDDDFDFILATPAALHQERSLQSRLENAERSNKQQRLL